MINLFRQVQAEQGKLTAALLALLEHSDRALLNGFLRRAGLGYETPPDAELQFEFPAPDDSGTAGRITGPHFRITLAAQAPDQPFEPPPPTPDTVMVTLAGRAAPAAHVISWEQVDRWLGAAVEQYDADSRTGFLLRQFRDFLRDSGVEYFPGFEAPLLEAAPGALRSLSDFYRQADTFFERLGPGLSAATAGLAELRRSRAEDLMAGYCYRDFSGAALGPSAFLRVAFHLPQQELQVSLWLGPGPVPGLDAHGRLRTALLSDSGFRESLQGLGGGVLLWLWSAADERKMPLEEATPDLIAGLDWAQYQAAVQVVLPFTALAGEGLTERTAERAGQLLEALRPVLGGTLH